MPTLVASPPDTNLLLDRDTDVDIKTTAPAGTYLPATSWSLYFEITNPTTGAVILSKTQGAGIVVTTAGSSSVDAAFTISLAASDLTVTAFKKNTPYNWKFKRNDPGSEVDIDGGTIKFRR